MSLPLAEAQTATRSSAGPGVSPEPDDPAARAIGRVGPPASGQRTIQAALSADAETDWLDFKSEFDPASAAAWCEIVKDIIAMANSGGGFIVIGLQDDGSPSSPDVGAALRLDPAEVTNKVSRYTGMQFGSFSLHPRQKGERGVQVVCIEGIRYPIVFSHPGSYELPNNKQGRAFSVGQVYFRHGAKSEPGNTDDLRRFVDQEVSRLREEWLGNIRKVVEAPRGSVVSVAPLSVLSPPAGPGIAARLVNAPDAVEVPWRNPDETHPFRQKEAVIEINRRIQGRGRINGFDIQVARKHFKMELDPNLVHKPKYGSFQYSHACVDWLVTKFEQDTDFFQSIRDKNRGDATVG